MTDSGLNTSLRLAKIHMKPALIQYGQNTKIIGTINLKQTPVCKQEHTVAHNVMNIQCTS